MSGAVGASGSSSYSLTITDAPVENSECTITNGTGTPGPWSGPSYNWDPVGGSGNGIEATLTPSGTTSTLNVKFLKPGDYTVSGGVSYSSSCGDESGSDSKTVKVHVATAATLTATAKNSHSIALSWSPAAGNLYRSMTKGFTPDPTNLILTSDGKVSTKTDAGLAPLTTYYYIFAPTDASFSNGSASDTTLQKIWKPGDLPQGGDIVKPAGAAGFDPAHPLVVEQNSTLDLDLSPITDKDHWTDGDEEGDEADTNFTYKWTAPTGTFSSDSTAATKWTAPALTSSDEIKMTLSVDIENPETKPDSDGGTRVDPKITRSIAVVVKRPKWSAVPDIGQHHDPDTNKLVPDGRMIAPQDQRGNYDSSEQQAVVSGARVPCKVEAATDLDTLTAIDSTTSESQDEVNYTWSAKRSGDQGSDTGHFEWQDTDANGQPITQTGQTAPTTDAVWVAPSDVTKDTQFTLKCTIDDKPLLPNSPTEGGTRDDKALERTVTLKGQDFKVTFDGLARACAGGIGVDGVHSFTITGTANKADGSLASNTTFKLSFDGNKGHDYSNDDPSLWPDEWTNPPQDSNGNPVDPSTLIKKAKFVTTDDSGNQKLAETMNVTTDGQGQFSVTVLSSDIVTQDIKVKVKWTDADGNDQDVGSQACDFGAAESIVRDPNNLGDPNDLGWLFNGQWLQSGDQTTAKVYMKFMINPKLGDVNGNWQFVNGHRMLINVDSIDPSDSSTPQGALSDYATVVGSQPDGSAIATTANDGAATVMVQAGSRIQDATTVYFAAYDESQWDN